MFLFASLLYDTTIDCDNNQKQGYKLHF